MVTISGITSPAYSAPDNSMIDVVFATKEHGLIPCSLHPDDVAEYVMLGKPTSNGQLFAMAKNGGFGAVAPYSKVQAPA